MRRLTAFLVALVLLSFFVWSVRAAVTPIPHASAPLSAPLCSSITNGQILIWNANRACWQPTTLPLEGPGR